MSGQMLSGNHRARWALLALAIALATGCSNVGASGGPSVEAASADVASASIPEASVVAQARDHVEDLVESHAGGVPYGFLEADRLFGECVASFGFEVMDPEKARQSGIYYFNVGQDVGQVDAAANSCMDELADADLIIVDPEEAARLRYEAYVEVWACLVAGGFQVTDPPSLEAYLESPESWTPWDAMIGDASHIFSSSEMQDGRYAEYFESLDRCPRP